LIRVVLRQTNFDKIAHKIDRMGDYKPEIVYEAAHIVEVDPRDDTALAKVNSESRSQFVTVRDDVELPVIAAFRLLATKLQTRHPILLKDTLGHRTTENDEARMTNNDRRPNERMTKSGSGFVIPSRLTSRRFDSALVSAIFTASLPGRSVSRMDKIRNIAIIAHVDHGKTTLVDQLLRQSGTFRSNQKIEERVMDSMDLEREKGITIRAKNAAFHWNGYRINIVDTPGHADFGGEVERIMKMVDGVLLVVDAHDGPQAQTRFVLRKALENKAKPIVVINKIDRENARPHRVVDMVFDLFVELKATDEQLDFPIIYASAKNGFAVRELFATGNPSGGGRENNEDMTPLFEAIVQHVPPPKISSEPFFQMLVSNLDYSDYLGRIALGRIVSGGVAVGDSIVCIQRDGRRERATVTALFTYEGLEQVEIKHATAGEIVGVTGFDEVYIGETLTDLEERTPLQFVDIDPPTIRMHILVNDSPFAGREGKYVTARHIRERLTRETRGNVSLQVNDTETAGVFEINARGEMQIAILVEQMRREGYEVMVSRPEAIFHRTEDGNLLEPLESLYVDLPNENLGDILQSIANRKGEIVGMDHHTSRVSIEAIIPTRGLIGFETDLVNMTRGEGLMSHLFREYAPFKGEIGGRGRGVMVSMEYGVSTAYALNNIQARGRLFIGPQEDVYEGMIVGENARPEDLPVNPCKAKHLTNMRSQGEGKGIQLEAPLRMTLERAIEYIDIDEYVEATPKSLRLRKRILDATARKRAVVIAA
jgi:GTP-binding protein